MAAEEECVAALSLDSFLTTVILVLGDFFNGLKNVTPVVKALAVGEWKSDSSRFSKRSPWHLKWVMATQNDIGHSKCLVNRMLSDVNNSVDDSRLLIRISCGIRGSRISPSLSGIIIIIIIRLINELD